MNWKYRGTVIELDPDSGVFRADVDDDRIEAPSLVAIKKKIATRQDVARKFDVECVLAVVQGIDYDDRTHAEDIEISVTRAQFRGYNLTTGAPRLVVKKEGEDQEHGPRPTDRDVDVEWNTTLYGFPPPKPGDDEKPLALRRLEIALVEYKAARDLFNERLEKIQGFRLVQRVGKSEALEVETSVAERLAGAVEASS